MNTETSSQFRLGAARRVNLSAIRNPQSEIPMNRSEVITELEDLRDRALNEASILEDTLALLRAGAPEELPGAVKENAPSLEPTVVKPNIFRAQEDRQIELCREQYEADCEGRASMGAENRPWEEFVAAYYGRAADLCPMHVLAAGPR